MIKSNKKILIIRKSSLVIVPRKPFERLLSYVSSCEEKHFEEQEDKRKNHIWKDIKRLKKLF